MTPLVALFSAIILLAGAAAYSRGGPPEKLSAVVIITWAAIDTVYHLLFGPSGFDEVDPVHVVLDGGELAAIMWVALRANRCGRCGPPPLS